MRDKEGTVTVALWQDMVGQYEKGQKVKISKCRVKLFNGEKKLRTTTSSTCEVRKLLCVV